ncbi:MAG TPA: DUF2330 domain-containing protein, partial [bacterium]|nr:DUF2330 domain-containing protein [bacterium]
QQRAIIAWNGTEEILLLSTDQRATQRSAVLEVIPLPSRPSIKLGSFATFEEAQKLVINKRMWVMAHGGKLAGNLQVPQQAARITFEKKMGAHDLTVAEVLEGDAFVAFVQDYLKNKYGTQDAPIRPEFVKIIESYIEEGFKWFAFDVIVLGDKNQSREPIEYRFASDRVFYPMRISTLERGETKVDLLVFTAQGANHFEGLPAKAIEREPQLSAVAEDFAGLEETWKKFFPAELPLKIDHWKVRGDIASFDKDILVR